jgi:hypothetical protein
VGTFVVGVVVGWCVGGFGDDGVVLLRISLIVLLLPLFRALLLLLLLLRSF